MNTVPAGCIVYDISILASVRVSRTGDRIEEFVAYPEVPGWLEEQRRRGFRLGVRVDPEKIPRGYVVEALRRAGLLGYLDSGLLFIGPRSTLPPAGSAECPQRGLVVVDLDAGERSRIRSAGLLSAPHPVLAEAVLKGEARLRFVRIGVVPPIANTDWRARLHREPLVPLYVSAGPPDGERPVVYAISDGTTAARLNESGFEVALLGEVDEPQWSDVYLVMPLDEEAFHAPVAGANKLDRLPEGGTLVAVPAADPEIPGFVPRFFHSRKLVPSTAQWESAPPLGPSPLPAGFAQGLRILSDKERETIRQVVVPDAIKRDVDRYSGAASLGMGVTIISRELKHPDNRRAVCSLADDLEHLGGGRLSVRLHPFTNVGVQCANVEATLPRSGLGGAVIVCAHLDSTVDPTLPGSHPHDPEKDLAPGADDNASGIAGVLCVARALTQLAASGAMHREIRFVLFNSEEYGVAGSQLYALDRQQLRDAITAVFNMDMIGYDAVAPSYFELHAGNQGELQVAERSRDLGRLVAAIAPEVSDTVLVPQFQFGVGSGDAPNEHSDHSSFQQFGFPACLVSEDFTQDPGHDAPEPDRTPGYHLRTDTVVCPGYAADLARAVAAAAWVAATLR